MFVIRYSNSATWVVDNPAGSNVTIVIRDATGELAQTLSRVVEEGSNECMYDELVI